MVKENCKFLWLVAGCFNLLVASSCVVLNHDYPVELPKLVESDADIEKTLEGKYKCVGVDLKYYQNAYMKNYFFARKENMPSACEYILVKKNNKGINIDVYANGNLLKTKLFEIGKDYEIDNGFIKLKKKCEIEAASFLGYQCNIGYVTINESKNMVIKNESNGFGFLYYLIPIGGISTEWLLFKNIADRD